MNIISILDDNLVKIVQKCNEFGRLEQIMSSNYHDIPMIFFLDKVRLKLTDFINFK